MAGACSSASSPESKPIRLSGTLNVDAAVTRWSQVPSCLSTLPLLASARTVHITSARAVEKDSAAQSAVKMAIGFKIISVIYMSAIELAGRAGARNGA